MSCKYSYLAPVYSTLEVYRLNAIIHSRYTYLEIIYLVSYNEIKVNVMIIYSI